MIYRLLCTKLGSLIYWSFSCGSLETWANTSALQQIGAVEGSDIWNSTGTYIYGGVYVYILYTTQTYSHSTTITKDWNIAS